MLENNIVAVERIKEYAELQTEVNLIIYNVQHATFESYFFLHSISLIHEHVHIFG